MQYNNNKKKKGINYNETRLPQKNKTETKIVKHFKWALYK